MEPKIRKFAASYNILPYFLSLILAIMFGYAEYYLFIGKFSSGILRIIYLFLFAALTILCLIFLLRGFLLALNFYSYSADKTGINFNTPIKTILKILKPILNIDFILLKLKNGKMHLLSPREPKKFIMEFNSKSR